MAYTAIPDPDIAVGKPGSNSLFTLLRDNPIGIANGDALAPRIQTAAYALASVDQAAIGNNAVGTGELIDNNVTGAKITAGNVTFAREINTPSDDVNLTSTTGGTAIPAGVYNLGRSTTTCHLEIYCGPTRGWQNPAGVAMPVTDFDQQITSDGVSVRLRAVSTGGTVQARRIAV